jgi:uncharacterized protein (TIGR02145 family)
MKKNNFIAFVYALVLLNLISCKKDEPKEEPVYVEPIAFEGDGVYDYDSNFYKTVKIVKNGEWMAENLRTSHFSNGDTIFSGRNLEDISGLGSPKFFFYPNGDSVTNLKKYGRLYTYYVVEDGRNVCPTGWHVPTREEFDTLTKYVGGQDKAGGKLKATNTWASPNTGADNETMFSALPAGFREPDNVYSEVTKTGIWWTITPDTSNRIWTFYLKYTYSYVFRTPADKNFAYSIRCKKNY